MINIGDLTQRRLRTWIRLLRMTRRTENYLREYMRQEHGTTLPRFDVMSALYRHGGPLRMTAISQILLVSNGNASAVVDRLEKDGLVRRVIDTNDRRIVNVILTDEGRRDFNQQAAGHAELVDQILGDLTDQDLDQLRELLQHAERSRVSAVEERTRRSG